MYYYIFETTNKITNERYRGIHSSKTLKDMYLGSSVALKKAIKEYGRDNFEKKELEYCLDFNELLVRQHFYITPEWLQREDTYNKKLGQAQKIGIERCIETKKNISNAMKRKYEEGFSPVKGKVLGKRTEEQRKNISDAMKLAYANGYSGSFGKRWEKESPTEEQIELMIRKRLEAIEKKKSVEKMAEHNQAFVLKLKM